MNFERDIFILFNMFNAKLIATLKPKRLNDSNLNGEIVIFITLEYECILKIN